MNIIDAIVIAFLLAIVALFRYAWKYRKTAKPKRWYINSAKEQSRRLGVRRAEEKEFGRRPTWKPVTHKAESK